MKVRIQDIAQKAGVSPATVSNVLNRKGGVGEEKARKILSIAREMGYQYERTSTSRKAYIRLVVFKRHGLVVMDTQFFADMVEAITIEAEKLGYDIVVSHIHMEKDKDYLDKVSDICREDCAGIILVATEMHRDDLLLFTHCKAPLLVLDSLFQNEEINCVVMNNFEAGNKATERLIAMGHRRIEHITASVRFNNMGDRRKGFEGAMARHNLPVSPSSVWSVTPTIEGAYRDMLSLLSKRKEPLPTAFFAANDIMAMGCVRALQEQGVRIPEDISIIGMDDLDLCQASNPPISSIHVYRQDLSRVAVHRLADMMDENYPDVIQKIQVGVTLVERASILDLNGN